MSAEPPQAVASFSDRSCVVTLVVRTGNNHLLRPPLDLPDGVEAEIDGPEIVFKVPIRAPDAATALGGARETVLDLIMTLTSTFNGYNFVADQRQVTSRTDAV